MKKLTSLFFTLLCITNTAVAQVTTVDGVGVDKNSAVRDAMRNAVENVVGTFIDSRTLVSQSVVALDEVYAKSQGFVKDIKILREFEEANNYRVAAQIDVDTNPNSQLMDRLSMIMMLNDPRIAVVVDYYNDGTGRMRDKYPVICEAAMNNKLLELGFNHIVDSNIIKDSAQKVNLHNSDTDYMVLGKLDITTNNVTLPNYSDITKSGETPMVRTGLIKSLVEFDAKVMKTDTQEIIGQFRVEANSMKGDANTTENQAVKQVGIKAAESLRKIFAVKAANVNSSVRIIVRTDNDKNLLELEKAVKEISGVENAFIRSYAAGKGIIEADTILKPAQIYRALKEKLSLFMETSSDNTLEVSI